MPFTIEVSDLVIPERCPVLGLPLSTDYSKRTDATASVDRVIPTIGYVSGNVRVISWRANRLKSNATPEELRRLAAYASGPL